MIRRGRSVGPGVAATVLVGLVLLGSVVAALPHLVVAWADRRDPEVVFSVETAARVAALTIDDGPSSSTDEILAVLDEYDVRATFFLIGDHMDARPGVVRRIVDAGHELGHHMMADRPTRDLEPSEFRDRFDAMDRKLDGLGGSCVFRPGAGWYDDGMVDDAARRGYRTVLGSVYPFDTVIPFAGVLSRYVLQNTAPGSVLILHDGDERGRRTTEVLRTVLPELQRRGYRIGTVSGLLARAGGPSVGDCSGRDSARPGSASVAGARIAAQNGAAGVAGPFPREKSGRSGTWTRHR